MKKISVLIAGIAAIALWSCKNGDDEKPKVIYKKTEARNTIKEDTTQFEIADLPIQIPGTDVIVHPIGNYRTDGKRKAAYGYEKGSFTISNFSELELTGFLQNIKFQKADSDSIVSLTDMPVLIQTATMLRNAEKSRQQIIVYTLSDKDTNQDGKLDANDIRSLYLSTIEGNKFTKISPDLHELIDWNLIEPKGRLYFRTIEDTNKNGEFDNNDVLHYQFVDLTRGDWQAQNYNPVK